MSGEQGQANPGGQPGSAGEGLLEADPLKAVVGLLRYRAWWARISAFIFLFGLIVTVLAGLAFYLLLPFWESYIDARKATLESIQAEIAEENTKVDADRAALMRGKESFDTENRGLAALLRNQWEPVEVRRLAVGGGATENRNHFVAGGIRIGNFFSKKNIDFNIIIEDIIIIYGMNGSIIRSSDGGKNFEEIIPEQPNTGLWGHILLDDAILLYGPYGMIMRSSDKGASFQRVRTNTDAIFSEHIHEHLVLDDAVLIYGPQGIWRSTDNGITFETVTIPLRSANIGPDRISHEDFQHVMLDDAVLIYTWGGAFLRSDDGGATFQTVHVQVEGPLIGHITLETAVLIYGSGGMILRSTDNGMTFEAVHSPSEPDTTLLVDHIVLDDAVLIYSRQGTILRSSDGGVSFQTIGGNSESVFLIGHIVLDEALLIYDNWGMILRSTDSGVTFESVNERLSFNGATATWGGWNHMVLGETVLIYGQGGVILRSTNGGVNFEAVQTPLAHILNYVPFDGGALVYGGDKAAVVTFDYAAGFNEIPLGSRNIEDQLSLEDNLLVYDSSQNVFRLSNRWYYEFIAVAPSQGTNGDATLAQFFDNTLPDHIRDWEPVEELRARLDGIINRRSALSILEERTDARLAELDWFPYAQWRREQLRLDLATFLATCRGQEDFGSEITQACLAAWQDRLASGEGWWRVLVDQIPPGILILFLLATTGSLYRYNLRLAGFHDSRADALELLARGRDKDSLRDLLAVTPGDAVNLATIFLGADKVEMGAIRAKLGQAEVELAKTLRASES